jgi:hypothetical protein
MKFPRQETMVLVKFKGRVCKLHGFIVDERDEKLALIEHFGLIDSDEKAECELLAAHWRVPHVFGVHHSWIKEVDQPEDET